MIALLFSVLLAVPNTVAGQKLTSHEEHVYEQVVSSSASSSSSSDLHPMHLVILLIVAVVLMWPQASGRSASPSTTCG